jgi:CheY-like chemotaxis protein
MKGHVLVVDDERAICTTMTAILEDCGFDVVSASSATDAKQALEQSAFDLVITDLQMETPTAGYDVTELASKGNPQPAIVLISAYPSAMVQWQEHGAHARVEKPVPVATLLATLDELLQKRAAHM